MKKIIFVFTVIFIIFALGCKKKVEPVVAPPPTIPSPPKISEVQFLLGLSERTDVKNLKPGDSLVVAMSSEEVNSPSAGFAIVKPFNADLNYYQLRALLKKLPLTVVWVGRDRSHLLIWDYEYFIEHFKSNEKFLILEPKPAYYIRAGSKEYWVGKEGKFWKTWI